MGHNVTNNNITNTKTNINNTTNVNNTTKDNDDLNGEHLFNGDANGSHPSIATGSTPHTNNTNSVASSGGPGATSNNEMNQQIRSFSQSLERLQRELYQDISGA